jgi:hypothetical protein
MSWTNQISYIDMSYKKGSVRQTEEFVFYVDDRRQKKLKLSKIYPELATRGYKPFIYKSNILSNDRQIYICLLQDINSKEYKYLTVAFRDNSDFYIFKTIEYHTYCRGVERFEEILYDVVLDDDFRFYTDFTNGVKYSLTSQISFYLFQPELYLATKVIQHLKYPVNNENKDSRKFILLARHIYNKFFETDSQCPICCEEYGDISRLNITICGHSFCKDCLYKNPNHLCPICKEVIEKK